MKIAIISDLFPPAFIGGYEIGMSWLAAEFRRRGYRVDIFHCRNFYLIDEAGDVKTYSHAKTGLRNFDIGPGLAGRIGTLLRRKAWRWPWFLYVLAMSQRSRVRFARKLETERYDFVLMGNPLGLLAPIYQIASNYARVSTTRVGLLVSDNWVAAWPTAFVLHRLFRTIAPSPGALRRRGKRALLVYIRDRLLRRLRKWGMFSDRQVENWFLDFVVCVSEYIRSISSPRISAPATLTVAHWGLPLASIETGDELPDFSEEQLRLVYVGQIEAHKGLATLLKAVSLCKCNFSLTVIGDDTTRYALGCKEMARDLGLEDRIAFTGKLPQGEVYNHLRRSHVMVVPSEWEEPYAIVPLQGKLCGLVTVVSDTGGSAEGIADEVDGFLFERGNAGHLAQILSRLDAERDLCNAISRRARSQMLEQGDISRMADQILVSAGVVPCA